VSEQPVPLGEATRREVANGSLPFRIPQRILDQDLTRVQVPPSHVETPEDRDRRLRRQAAGKRAAWEKRLPKRYATANLAELHAQQDPGRLVSGWLAGGHLNLLLHGLASRGKTHAAYAVCADALAKGMHVVAWTMADLNAALRPGAEAESDAFREVTTCEVFLLDDLGREKVTDWTLEQLQRVLDARNRGRLRTVVTTNLGYDMTTTAGGAPGIIERYDKPIADRLMDDTVVVKVEGDNLRPPARF